jgi:hypothetical protein
MTELEQINEKLNKILALLQPKKEVKNISNGLDEVRAELRGLKPYPMDYKVEISQINEGWDYVKLPNGSLGFYDRKAYLKALQEWKANNNI